MLKINIGDYPVGTRFLLDWNRKTCEHEITKIEFPQREGWEWVHDPVTHSWHERPIDIWAQAMGGTCGDTGDENPVAIEEAYPIPLIAEPKPETKEEIDARAWKAIQDLSHG